MIPNSNPTVAVRETVNLGDNPWWS